MTKRLATLLLIFIVSAGAWLVWHPDQPATSKSAAEQDRKQVAEADRPSAVNPLPTSGADLNALIAQCHQQAQDTPQRILACNAYQVAVINTIMTYTGIFHTPLPFCFPDEPTGWDIDTTVIDYLSARPEALTWAAPAVMINAIASKFPCTPKPKDQQK